MTDINNLIDTCAEITRSKGFDVTQHATHVALMASEAAEALEHVTETGDRHTDRVIRTLVTICNDFEAYRKRAKDYTDQSQVKDLNEFLEELSDQCIRVFSYVGGNGYRDQFVEIMLSKIDKNRTRPVKHGKGF